MKKTLIASSVAAGLLAMPALSVAESNGFVEDAKANLNLRNLYYNGDPREGTNAPRDEEWGQGFLLNFQSGYTQGPIGLGLDALAQAGIRLDSGGRKGKPGQTREPGGMFPLQDNGQAVSNFSRIDFTAKAKVSETELKYGVLQPNLPILKRNDGRLLPQTYRGGTLTTKEIDNLTLTMGQMDKASGRNSTHYDGLRIPGGNERVNTFQFAGGDAKLGDNLVTSYYFAKLKDYYKQHYLGALHTLELGEGRLLTDLRYFDSNSTGANRSGDANYAAKGINNNGEVDNRALSAMFTYQRSNHSLGLGYQKLSGDSNFAYVNNGDGGGGTAHLITDSLINKFERAGEKTWVGEYSYDFADYVPGLSFSSKYLRGRDFDTAAGDRDHEWERNLRVDYTIQQGFLKDLGVSLRHGVLRSDADRNQDQARVYVTYNFVLL